MAPSTLWIEIFRNQRMPSFAVSLPLALKPSIATAVHEVGLMLISANVIRIDARPVVAGMADIQVWIEGALGSR